MHSALLVAAAFLACCGGDGRGADDRARGRRDARLALGGVGCRARRSLRWRSSSPRSVPRSRASRSTRCGVVVGGLLLSSGCNGCARRSCAPSGLKAMHDEDAIFAAEVALLRAERASTRRARLVRVHGCVQGRVPRRSRGRVHRRHVRRRAAATSGSRRSARPPRWSSCWSPARSCTLPLSRVPENTLKFGVGVMLTLIRHVLERRGRRRLVAGRRRVAARRDRVRRRRYRSRTCALLREPRSRHGGWRRHEANHAVRAVLVRLRRRRRLDDRRRGSGVAGRLGRDRTRRRACLAGPADRCRLDSRRIAAARHAATKDGNDQLLPGDRDRVAPRRHRAVPDLEPRSLGAGSGLARLGHAASVRSRAGESLRTSRSSSRCTWRPRSRCSSTSATDWARIIRGFFQHAAARGRLETADERMAWLLIVATIPAGIIGLVFEHALRTLFAKPLAAAIFLTVNGVDPARRRAVRRRRGAVALDRRASDSRTARAKTGADSTRSSSGGRSRRRRADRRAVRGHQPLGHHDGRRPRPRPRPRGRGALLVPARDADHPRGRRCTRCPTSSAATATASAARPSSAASSPASPRTSRCGSSCASSRRRNLCRSRSTACRRCHLHHPLRLALCLALTRRTGAFQAHRSASRRPRSDLSVEVHACVLGLALHSPASCS